MANYATDGLCHNANRGTYGGQGVSDQLGWRHGDGGADHWGWGVCMTPTERRYWFSVLGWEQRDYARRIGWDEATVRRWMRGARDAPEAVDAWLGLVGRFMERNPPPARQSFPRKGLHQVGRPLGSGHVVEDVRVMPMAWPTEMDPWPG